MASDPSLENEQSSGRGGVQGEDVPAICTDFEFSMEMASLECVSADELFSNGKLLPLHPHLLTPTLKQSTFCPKASLIEADQRHKIHHPPASLWASPPVEGGVFAPPSPEPPKCSGMLKEMLWSHVGGLKEGTGTLLATRKLWRQLVRGVIAAGKGGGVLRSSIPGENAKDLGSSHANSCKLKLSPASSSPSSPITLARSVGRGGEVACADDLHILLGPKTAAFRGRCISMPSSRCSSPGRGPVKSIFHKPIQGGSERSSPSRSSSPSMSGRANSTKPLMKNLEWCSTRHNFAPGSHTQSINGATFYRESQRSHNESNHGMKSHRASQGSHDQSINGLKSQRESRRSYDQSINAMNFHRESQRSHEKTNSYSSNVRVTPVLNVPLSMVSPRKSTKVTKSRFASLKDLFSLNKEMQI